MRRAAVVLAAGQGTRFRSATPKVLHAAAGRSMLRWVLEALRPLGLDRVVVVIGHGADEVRAEAEAAELAGLVTVVQERQGGTGHAVRAVLDAGALGGVGAVLVVPGDVPLLRPEPLARLLELHDEEDAPATLLTTLVEEPYGYGRVLRDEAGRVVRVVEERDATPAERAVREVNTSIYAFDVAPLAAALGEVTTENAQGEEYLTDVVELLAADGVHTLAGPEEDVQGVNDRAQLAGAATILRGRVLDRLMREAGVSVVDPATTYVDATVEVAADAVLHPGTHLEGGTQIGAGAQIGPDTRIVDSLVEKGATVAYSVLLKASVGPAATVGPFSYLRPGTRLERGAKVGAFVEVKKSTVGEGSKVPHLSYIGDATIGRDANIGAATVTVNYDGVAKHATVIGDGAFVGSDTMLVAPVRVGVGAVTGAGSVITKDVPDGALAVERSEQRHVEGWAARRAARAEQPPTDA